MHLEEPGASFECAIDSPNFVPCASPWSKKVKPGRYVFGLRAVDAHGNRDASAAVEVVKVKPRR